MTTARVGIDITANDNTSTAFLSAIKNVKKLDQATASVVNRQRILSFQLNDVFTQLSTGTGAFQVLAQQGPQIAQLYGFGNGGVGAAFRDLGSMMWTVAKRVGPLAAVAGGLAAGLTYEVNQATGETYSMGEVFTATMEVMSQSVTALLLPAIRSVEPEANSVFGSVMNKAKSYGNLLIGVNMAWLEVLKRGLSELPDVFKYAGAAAANFFIQQIENMINGAARLLNVFTSGINRMFEKLPEHLQPGKIGQIGKWVLPKFDTGALKAQVNNPFKGLGGDLGAIVGKDYIGALASAIGNQAAQDRLKAAAKTPALKALKPHPLQRATKDKPDKAYGFKDISQNFSAIEQGFDSLTAVSDIFQNSLTQAFDSVADGTTKVSKAFGNMGRSILADVGKMFLNQGIKSLFAPDNSPYGGGGGLITNLLGGLFGGFRAAGGPVNAGQGYVVGENGPEWFEPNASGRIISNSGLAAGASSGGGGVTIIDQRSNAPAIEQSVDSDGRIRLIVRDAMRSELPAAMVQARRRGQI
jgi:Prophage tail length tape measure protein